MGSELSVIISARFLKLFTSTQISQLTSKSLAARQLSANPIRKLDKMKLLNENVQVL